MKYIVSLIIIFTITNQLFPQQFNNWKNYTDMKPTNDISVSSDGIWAATVGGAYFYNFLDKSFKKFSKSEGLNGTSLLSVAVDKHNKIWFGSESGIIDIYDPSTDSFHSILDIYNSDKTNKKINGITASGDTIFVATDFGVSLIDANNYSFIDTYFKFGNFSSNIKVNSILISNLIYVATESGVAIQKPGATNLSAPESWDVFNQSNGLPSNSVKKLLRYNNNIVAATNNGLSIFDGTNWQNFLSFSGTQIIDLAANENLLYILAQNSVYLFDGSSTNQIADNFANASKIGFTNNSLFISTNKGILSDGEYIYPNGPAANQFPNMVVDGEGNLWSASGKDLGGVGFYTYDGFDWKTYDVQHYPVLLQNGYYQIFAGSNNTIYAGNWGQGFVRLRNDKIERFDSHNTNLIGIPKDINFVVITGLAEDQKNNLWILNYWAADRNTLSMLTPDSSWYFFTIPAEQNRILEKHFKLIIDRNGTKWYFCQDEARSGLFYFNEKGTYSNIADDISGYLSTSNGLTSNSIFDIVIDRRGDLWVGTSLGVNIISNLSTVLNSVNPQFRISSSFSVRQQTINAIAVDPLNQKWVGTNEGLFLLNSDGTQLLATLNSKNSSLLSDRITSIAIDEKTGRVYVGTEAGLTSFDTPSILPVESFSGLNIYPNPFVLKDGSQLVTIDGLIRDTDIKVVSVSGKLIREFSSPGGRTAFWDGKDDNGDLVSSGIYIIIAFDKEGNSVETGKIAVLRQ